jgi:hypothetical protein
VSVKPFIGYTALLKLILVLWTGGTLAFGFPQISISLGGGYAGYSPSGLDSVNKILESTYRTIDSTNQYATYRFDGQGAFRVGVGMELAAWYVGLESAIWQENFPQKGISVDAMGIKGEMDVGQTFWFAPLVLKGGYTFRYKKLKFRPGYGLGAMLGGGAISLVSRLESREDDELSFTLSSGFNLVQTFSCEAAYPVRPWLQVGVSLEYRLAKIRYFKVAKTNGSSYLFSMLFDADLKTGDRLYFGYDTLRFVTEDEVKSGYRKVIGNLNGLTITGQLIFSLPGLR